MREESAFNPDAISPADAVGLMQIIPPTAERIAEDLGVPYARDMLHSPRTSIAFGSYYLRRLLDRFGNQVPLALAAYNAGPQAVSRWLAAGEALPLDVWVAKIPYTETRRYVRRVMANLARYSYLHGGSEELPALALSIPKGLRAEATDY
jgi:soluble lytic murein transglycosylase